MFDLIKKLSGSFGVSGNEEEIREVIRSEIQGKVEKIEVDDLGNLIGVKKGKGKKIMEEDNKDEIGVKDTNIEEKE